MTCKCIGDKCNACERKSHEMASEIRMLNAEIIKLEEALETERIRLAACGVAALGYFDGCHEKYKSASLDDVLRLYESCKCDKLALEAATKESNSRRLMRRLTGLALHKKCEKMIAHVKGLM